MKILILGGGGMLGHKMTQRLSEHFIATTCTVRKSPSPWLRALLGNKIISDVDVRDVDSLKKRLQELAPDVLVNCVGIVKQRDEAKSAIPSIAINALLPHQLAAWAAEWNGRVIHFSTDCVFSGKRGRYTEDDPSDAEDLYGKSKYLGEVATPNALTLRTSIIGRELSQFASLLEWFLGQNHQQVRGYKKVLYAGITTNYLATLVLKLIAEHPKLSGVYQVASTPISKFDLLCLLREAYNADIEIEEDLTTVSDRSMLGGRFQKATGIVVPPWSELVSELASDATPYDDWR